MVGNEKMDKKIPQNKNQSIGLTNEKENVLGYHPA